MILQILRGARWLDKKLEETVGRPYRVLISAALIAEIVAQLRALARASLTRASFVQTLIWIVIAVLVVINQLGELGKRMDERPSRAAAGHRSHAGEIAADASPVSKPRNRRS